MPVDTRSGSRVLSDIGTVPTRGQPRVSPLSVRSTTEHQPAAENIDTRIADAERVRDELLKQRTLENLQREIGALQKAPTSSESPSSGSGSVRELTPPTYAGDPEILMREFRNQSIPSAPPKRSRDDFEAIPIRTHSFKPKSLRDYYGKTIREHRDWCRDAEVMFRQCSRYFSDDAAKILFSMPSLKGSPKEQWFNEEAKNPVELWTWDTYTNWLLDLIEDPMNRQYTVALAYENAAQKPTQSIREFEAYLSALEAQLPHYTQEQLAIQLFTKLKPALRNEIVHVGIIPSKREELLSLGARLETSTHKGNTAASKPTTSSHPAENAGSKTGSKKGKHNSRQGGGENKERAKPTITSTKNRSDVECYKCHKKGHYANECRSEKSDANRTPIAGVTEASTNESGNANPSSKKPRR